LRPAHQHQILLERQRKSRQRAIGRWQSGQPLGQRLGAGGQRPHPDLGAHHEAQSRAPQVELDTGSRPAAGARRPATGTNHFRLRACHRPQCRRQRTDHPFRIGPGQDPGQRARRIAQVRVLDAGIGGIGGIALHQAGRRCAIAGQAGQVGANTEWCVDRKRHGRDACEARRHLIDLSRRPSPGRPDSSQTGTLALPDNLAPFTTTRSIRPPMTDTLMRHLPDLALAAALAWGAGLRLYLVVLLCGLAARFGGWPLPDHLQVLQHPLVMGVAGFMTVIEGLADKVPWLDSLWDTVHTLIRIPAGAALAGAVFGDSGTAVATAAALLGGSLTATTHLAKSGARALVNTSPEPFSNIALSLAEDAAVIGGAWLLAEHPWVLLGVLACFTVLMLVMLRLLVRGARRLFGARARAVGSARLE
jgi:hypothetical protein